MTVTANNGRAGSPNPLRDNVWEEAHRIIADEEAPPPREKRRFVAGIRSTFWRRVAIVVVLPLFLIWHLRWSLLALPWLIIATAAVEAWRAVIDELDSAWNRRPALALRLGLSAMWSRAWADNSIAAIDAAGRRLREGR